MTGMQKGALVLALVAGGWLFGRKAGVLPGGTAKIEGAKFAGAVAVFPGARLEEEGGGNYYGEIGGPVTFTSHTWYFKSDKPTAEVIAWYRAHLPPGAKEEEAEDGEALWTWIPPGVKEGEDVTIRVDSEGFSVSESVKAGG
jgi:hypothetical protein